MSSFDAIRPGFSIVNGVELAGTVFRTLTVNHRTIIDKVRVVNYSGTAFFIDIGIIKLGQTVKVLETLLVRSRQIGPHTTLILDELRGEALDFPAEMFADVTSGAGVPAQFGNVSISITGTQKKN